MTSPAARRALQQYANVRHSNLEGASPHQVVTLLIEGATTRLSIAIRAMSLGAHAERGEAVSGAISIIGALRESLDASVGADVASTLATYYDSMTLTLLRASVEQDVEKLRIVHTALSELGAAWAELAGPQESAAGASAATKAAHHPGRNPRSGEQESRSQ